MKTKPNTIKPLKWSKRETVCVGHYRWRAKVGELTFKIDKVTDSCGDTWALGASLPNKNKTPVKTLKGAKARMEALREEIIRMAEEVEQ